MRVLWLARAERDGRAICRVSYLAGWRAANISTNMLSVRSEHLENELAGCETR
jgi:hypothetical protein